MAGYPATIVIFFAALGLQTLVGATTCKCRNPGTGNSAIDCDNGDSRACASDSFCYNAGGSVEWGQWGQLCDVWCKCDTPGGVAPGGNKFHCGDGYSAYCTSTDTCYSRNLGRKSDPGEFCRRAMQVNLEASNSTDFVL